MCRTTTVTLKCLCLLLLVAHIVYPTIRCDAAGDFNGDGKDDIITFLRDSEEGDGRGDVYVALSTGNSFGGGQRWHEDFCVGFQIPGVGDFNGDGKDDIIAFTRSADTGLGMGDVWVALSDGASFGSVMKWHEYFCIGNEIPDVGDFNGDGKDDIIIFVRNAKSGEGRGDVYVALSDGSSFVNAGTWHDFFCIATEIPAVGDFNGDGRDDIITFTRDTWSGNGRGDVYVAIAGRGPSFLGTGVKWHDWFCIGGEIPFVGDFNGDGKDDIATMATEGENPDKVYVALSTGNAFVGTGEKWTGTVIGYNPVPDSGDFNGDGMDDMIYFLHESFRDTPADKFVGDVVFFKSRGDEFHYMGTWHDYFCVYEEVPTTFAAVFPYYAYPRNHENIYSSFGGYTSDEESRFPGYVAGFIEEFDNKWYNSQAYWGKCHMLGRNHLKYVDNVDLAFLAGHGSPASITLCDGSCPFNNRYAWGSWSSHSKTGDLEYIAFESCKVTRLSGNWAARWRSGPYEKGPFSGLHVACGFHNNHQYTEAFSLGDEFAENLKDNFSVRWAWLEATDDEDDHVFWHTNIGSVIFLEPHRNERIGQHTSRDRWYHDPDYKLKGHRWYYD